MIPKINSKFSLKNYDNTDIHNLKAISKGCDMIGVYNRKATTRQNFKNTNKPKLNIHKPLKFSTYNVRTLYKLGNFNLLSTESSKLNLAFIAIQEHRWKTENEIDQLWSQNRSHLFIYSSADEKGMGGIGLLIQNKYTNFIKSFKKYPREY